MPGHMAAHVHCHRKPRNVGGPRQHMQPQAGGFSAQPLGAHACFIHRLQQLLLQLRVEGVKSKKIKKKVI